MAGLGNNLYPPIFKKAYAPAFATEGSQKGYKIYFSLSVYNSLSDLARYEGSNNVADLVQVSIQNQNTNYSALDLEQYRTGILFTSMGIESSRTSDDKYYIEIRPQYLAGKKFVQGQYYKLQIRFTSRYVTSKPTPKEVNESWLNENLVNFSEWSQVILLKGIKQPSLDLRGFSKDTNQRVFSLKEIDLIGRVNFDPPDNEYLKKYRVLLYDGDGVNLLEDSGDKNSNIYTNPNEVNYKIKYNLEDGEKYLLKIQLQSNNLYRWTQEYPFQLNLIQYTTLSQNSFTMAAAADKQAGWIRVSITSVETISNLGANFIIRRSSSKDGFRTWEDVHLFLAPVGQTVNELWFDRTVQSGTWYRYGLQQRNGEGFRSNMLQMKELVFCTFDNIYLLDGDKQLKIKFNPQVNNYSHVVSESLTQTIGSQYPFVRRNGNVDYRTFSLSGTISAFMDVRENGMKASFEDLYNWENGWQGASKYREYNEENSINLYTDTSYEKDFREQVIKFLYNNSVKLYKSATQGNILVKLMNISFTPNNTLSRHIYDFTCTAQQIDTFNIQNCDFYNIQPIGEQVAQEQVKLVTQGQVMVPDLKLYYLNSNLPSEYSDIYTARELFLSGKNLTFTGGEVADGANKEIITNYILPKYQSLTTQDIDVKIDYLSSLRIEFTSRPYTVVFQNGKFRKCSPTDTNGSQEQKLLGHIIRINDQEILVGSEGIYELSDPNTQIKSFSFLSSEETGVISYEAVIVEFERANTHPKEYENIYRIGQLFGSFSAKDSLFKKVYLKYYYTPMSSEINSSDITSQALSSIKGMRLYAKPGTVFLVKEELDNKGYDRFIIGDTGLLEFYDEQTDIKGVYTLGVQLKQNTNPNKPCADNEYYIEPGTEVSVEAISNPQKNHVYTISTPEGLVIPRSRLYSIDEFYNRGVILEENTQIIDIDAETAGINNELSNVTTCIYYQGGWYMFLPEEKMVVGCPTEVIMDYYCQILRKRY